MEANKEGKELIFKPKNRITFFIFFIFVPLIVFSIALYYDILILVIITLIITAICLFIWLRFILYYIEVDNEGISRKNTFFKTRKKIPWANIEIVQDIIEDFHFQGNKDNVRKLLIKSPDTSLEISEKSINDFEELYNIIASKSNVEVIDRTKK